MKKERITDLLAYLQHQFGNSPSSVARVRFVSGMVFSARFLFCRECSVCFFFFAVCHSLSTIVML